MAMAASIFSLFNFWSLSGVLFSSGCWRANRRCGFCQCSSTKTKGSFLLCELQLQRIYFFQDVTLLAFKSNCFCSFFLSLDLPISYVFFHFQLFVSPDWRSSRQQTFVGSGFFLTSGLA